MPPLFELQGHRGARGLRPENTLPAFEAAFDVGVTAVETDLHLTADGVPVVFHDHAVSEVLCRLVVKGTGPAPAARPLVATLTVAELRGYRADGNPSMQRFPTQDAAVTPLAQVFALERGLDPHAPPTLDELFAFATAYAGEPGETAGKTAWQRERAGRVCFDLELKRVPFRPERMGDRFSGDTAGPLEERVLDAVRRAGLVGRTTVRSFDHRSVLQLKRLEPALRTAVLVAGTAPVDPAGLVRAAGADLYCPDVEFLDREQLRRVQEAGVRAIPWTVNDPADWERLLDWGVDGITTDYPDRLAALLRRCGVAF